MNLLNEKGKLNKMAIFTYFLLSMLPFIIGMVLIETNFLEMNMLISFVLINLWGLVLGVYFVHIRKTIEKWKKEYEE